MLRTGCGKRNLGVWTLGAVLALPVLSQTPAPPDTPAPATAGEPKVKNGTSNDRLLFALPNFQTLEDVGHVAPLTAGQKYKLVLRSAFDPVQYPWYGMLAGIGQATNSEAAFGQGAEGYAKRYGAAFGDGVLENFMVGAVLPAALHQDPRFYQTSKGSAWHRLGYAMSRVVLTFSDSGKQQFNYSEILGSSMTATIATYSWHPRDERTIGDIGSVWGTQIGYDTLTYVTREFWPDLRRWLLKKKHPATVAKSADAQSH
jgi:hypothetical protein